MIAHLGLPFGRSIEAIDVVTTSMFGEHEAGAASSAVLVFRPLSPTTTTYLSKFGPWFGRAGSTCSLGCRVCG